MRAGGAQTQSVSRNTLTISSLRHILLVLSVMTLLPHRGAGREDGALLGLGPHVCVCKELKLRAAVCNIQHADYDSLAVLRTQSEPFLFPSAPQLT